MKVKTRHITWQEHWLILNQTCVEGVQVSFHSHFISWWARSSSSGKVPSPLLLVFFIFIPASHSYLTSCPIGVSPPAQVLAFQLLKPPWEGGGGSRQCFSIYPVKNNSLHYFAQVSSQNDGTGRSTGLQVILVRTC